MHEPDNYKNKQFYKSFFRKYFREKYTGKIIQAERINRTIKEEYLDPWKPLSFAQLKLYVKEAVRHYNNKRIHNNLDRMQPVKFIQNWKKQKMEARKIITIFNNELV